MTPKNIIIVGLLLVLVFVAYKSFAKKTDEEKSPTSKCPNPFTIEPLGGIVPGAVSTTYSASGGKYYSQTSGGFGGYSAQLAPREINESAYIEACDKYVKSQPAQTA